MELPQFFPNMKKGSTKDYIIRLLTLNKKLTNQKIFNGIKKQFGVSITYQSVRQALIELVETGVLIKQNKDYSISKTWIIQMHNFTKTLKPYFDS